MEKKRSRRGSGKRKSEGEMCPLEQKKVPICILHYNKSKCDSFTFLSDLTNPTERLQTLQNIRDLRLSQDVSSTYRMESVCELVPSEVGENHGYHRDCYQHFTKNVDRLKHTEPVAGTSGLKSMQRNTGSDTITLFANDCIFCNKDGAIAVKKGGTWSTESTKRFQSDAWKTVYESAQSKGDEKLLVRIRGVDLFAAEAHFHPSCRKKYFTDSESWKSMGAGGNLYKLKLTEAHEAAFCAVCDRVQKEILNDENVLKLTDLHATYTHSLEGTDFANAGFRIHKLKLKLDRKFGNRIAFCKFGSPGKFKSLLVYSACMKMKDAVESAFVLGSKDTLLESSALLRNAILDAFEKSGDLRWPPTAEFVEQSDSVIPDELGTFLRYTLSGKTADTSISTERLVNSIGQDICRAVTNGEWKLPKHILVAMTIRHLYRSKQLSTLLNRLGHSESHSFSLELETSIAKAVEETSSMLTSQIIRHPNVPSLFHSEFDNFDQLMNTMTGSGSIHTAHGIMMQEVSTSESSDHGGTVPDTTEIPRSKDRSLNLPIREELSDCFVGQRKSPKYPVTKHNFPGSEGLVDKTKSKDLVWVITRNNKCVGGQEVPGWAGFVSVTGHKPNKLTTIDYFPVINHPITEYRTVQECLRYAEEASKEVGQTYTVTTFDLGVCMKAFPIIWNNPEKYKNHIVMIGTFHLICAYLRMIGKKMAGCGLADILIEAGLIGSGSMQGVLAGKHYERAMHCHKVMVESLERLLIEKFLEQENRTNMLDELSEASKQMLDTLIESPSKDNLTACLNDTDICACISRYTAYKERVREGELGKTAKFWLSYMDHIWLVLALIRAVKTNDFLLYADCLQRMSVIFFSFDGQNYARYLTFFSLFIANLEESHPGATELLQRGAISVARSFIPASRCAVDKTMEETFMKHAKSRSGTGASGSGIAGIAGNYDAYQRWVRTTHERSKYVSATFNMADMLSESESGTRHRDLRPAEVQKSDREVCETIEAIKGFMDPFSTDDREHLYCVSSGARVPAENENDILMAEVHGKDAHNAFVAERLETQDKFFEPIKRLRLKTMEDMGKRVKVKASKTKVVEYKQQSNVAMQLLVQTQRQGLQIDLHELLKYPLTPVPFSIGTADGCLAKNDKSKGLKYLIEGVELADAPAPDQKLIVIEDGNALFHAMKEVPGNFKQISEKLFGMVNHKADVIFSTDMYNDYSVKAMERQRRGCGEKLLVKGGNTKKPADWKSFLSNADNKKQLVQVMCNAWMNDVYAKKLQGRNIMLVYEGEVLKFTSKDGTKTEKVSVEELKSTQEETDTRVVLYSVYAKQQGYKTIQIRTPDSDIFFILLHYMDKFDGVTILFDTGYGNHRKLINMTEIAESYTKEYRTALLGIHAFCGCDSTSAFKGKGHVSPIKVLQKSPRFGTSLGELGESWEIAASVIKGLEEYTCAIYGNTRTKSVDDLRFAKIKEKCEDKPTDALRNVDLGTLPPCQACLIQHIRRTNYQIAIWKRSHIADPNIPPVSEHHGWTFSDGCLEPLWTDGDLLPPQMIDILEETLQMWSDDASDDDDDDVDGNITTITEEMEEIFDLHNG